MHLLEHDWYKCTRSIAIASDLLHSMQDTPIQAMDKQTMTKCYTQTSDAIEKNIYVYNFEEKKLSRRYNKRTNQNENEKKKWT